MKKLDSYKFYIGSTFYFRFCWALMTTVSMVFMVTVAGLDPLQMVLVGTVLELSGFLLEIPTGVIADVYSRRLSMIIGYILVGLGFMLLGLFPTFEIILISQVIWGGGFTFISGASQAWISDEIGEEKANRSFIVASQYGKVGLLLGIIVCIPLASLDMRLPIIVGSGGLAALGIFAIFFMDEKNYRPALAANRETWPQMISTFKKGLFLVKLHPVIWIITVIAVFEGMFSEGFDRLYAPFLIESFEFPVVMGFDPIIWWGVMSAGSAIFAFVALDIVRRFVDTSNYRQLVITLTVSSVLLVGFMFSFALSQSFLLALFCYFFIATLRSVKSPMTSVWLNQNLESSTRATVFSMQAQADAFGQIGGGPIIGVVAKIFSIKIALLLSTLVLIPAIGMYRRALRVDKSLNDQKPD
ncbi:MAG: MFS transporter [Pseudomonadales bacterium]|nr:MFS transporter [Pseudomonadales bacterium]